MSTDQLPSPSILVDTQALDANIQSMQKACDDAGVELWPHVKTHKMVPVLKRQLDAGAAGATCAKVGEAEALLKSGVRQIFVAHSLVDKRLAPRLSKLAATLDRLVLAVSSQVHFTALEALLKEAKLRVNVLMAVDTGLNREGMRDLEAAKELSRTIRSSDYMELVGLYTHEGQSYFASSPQEADKVADRAHEQLLLFSDALDGLPLWPGCSVTAAHMAGKERVRVVRPGSYVFSDLYLLEAVGAPGLHQAALTILATVIDRPTEEMALIDAGSKIFSSDKFAGTLSGRCLEEPSIVVNRLSEEHGFLEGEGVRRLELGQRLRFVPAHVCPVVNLTDRVQLVDQGQVLDTWEVDARGRSD